MIKQFPIPGDILASSLGQTFGSQVDVKGFHALTGGARKKVFRLTLTHHLPDGPTGPAPMSRFLGPGLGVRSWHQ